MRLYLSSERLGEAAGALLAPLGAGGRVGIIGNAHDGCSETARAIYKNEVYDPAAEMAALGFIAEPLDLRQYFDKPAQMARALERYDFIWVTDGNAFVLRRAMAQSGFDQAISARLQANVLVYGGFGAGAIVAGTTLLGRDTADDPHEQPNNYSAPIIWDGLGLTDFAIVPHYRSAHPESAAAERATGRLRRAKTRFRTLSDGEVIVVISKAQPERKAS